MGFPSPLDDQGSDQQPLSTQRRHQVAFLWSAWAGCTPPDLPAGVRVILDLGGMPLADAGARLEASGAREIALWGAQMEEGAFDRLLEETGIATVWVLQHPALSPYSTAALLRRLDALPGRCRGIPVLTEVESLADLARHGPVPGILALKGIEGAGWVGTESVALMDTFLRQRFPQKGMRVWIWGGVALPEAAAALFATGAAGVVCEQVHWPAAGVSPEVRSFLEGLEHDQITVIGEELGCACRVRERGDAKAVLEAQALAASLSEASVPKDACREFVQRVRGWVYPPASQVPVRVPLGTEAPFAKIFEARFGSDAKTALPAFAREARRLALGATNQPPLKEISRELGTAHPIIQGAMSWITDVPGFARAVAEAGALPTLALGLRDAATLQQEFSDLRSRMGGRPFAFNLLALSENPFLEEQVAWIRRTRPPFLVIAAGDPRLARRFKGTGIRLFYIATEPGLMRLALEQGIRLLILEGNEAGGHVGRHSTLTLAQMALAFKRENPEYARQCRIFLAGGIFDAETALRARLLGADGVQMGTAYLATAEIVATGALQPLYQAMILGARPGSTVVAGKSAGLRVRALNTPKMEAVRALEREFMTGALDENAFRRRLETLTARSLRVAARGGILAPSRDEGDCLQEGQFMSGAVCGALQAPYRLAELHASVARGLQAASGRGEAAPVRVPRPSPAADRIAITGLSLANALGSSPAEVWERALAMQSGVREVDNSRWNHADIYAPNPGVPEKTYARVGAFADLQIDRRTLDLPPQDFRTLCRASRLSLWLAGAAIADAGLTGAGLDPDRVGVIITQNSGEAASTLPGMVLGLSVPAILRKVCQVVPLGVSEQDGLRRILREGLNPVDDTTLIGRLSSTAAGFISQRYGFRGPSMAVTAACASSLAGLYTAVHLLRAGVLDAAVVGGGEESLGPAHFVEFAALGALAGFSGCARAPEEMSRPFDAHRDGMVLGEGGGVVVLERESSARARGAPIHALIAGVGASNSDQGMIESLAESQVIAIRAAYTDAGYGPEQVEFVECHATGTVQGDREEAKALCRVFPAGRPGRLAAFKSQIGHTLGAAGITGLVRAVLALKHGVLPGTLNYRSPDPVIALERQGFRVAPEPDTWPAPRNGPRCAQVNAFGFGGTNYVVLLEASRAEEARAVPSAQTLGAGTDRSHVPGLFFFRALHGEQEYRVAVAAGDSVSAREKVKAVWALPGDPLHRARVLRDMAWDGVFAAEKGTRMPPSAMVFPGQGSAYPGMGAHLCREFPAVRRHLETLLEAAGRDLRRMIFEADEETLRRTCWQQPALFCLSYTLGRSLLDLGWRPHGLAGHSVGELAALCVAGCMSWQDGLRVVRKRAELMEELATARAAPGMMMAVDASMEALASRLPPGGALTVTNVNSPCQVVVGGAKEEILSLQRVLEAEGRRCVLLRVNMVFHAPDLHVLEEPFRTILKQIKLQPPRIPVISNVTGKPYPADPAALRRLLVDHLQRPVLWQQGVEYLWDVLGVRVFVEAGPGDTLGGLIAETRPEATCLGTCSERREADRLRETLGRLYALGGFPAPGPETELRRSVFPPDRPRRRTSGAGPKEDTLEEVIRIIMENTGYERHEIEPDMDLREDLAIRSSRLPLIMDAAEKRFKAELRLQDFLGVRTVRDVAERIQAIAGGPGAPPAEGSSPMRVPPAPGWRGKKRSRFRDPLRRFEFEERPLGETAPTAEIPDSKTLLFPAGPGNALADALASSLRRHVPGACRKVGDGEGGDPGAGLFVVLEAGAGGRTAPEACELMVRVFRCVKRALTRGEAPYVVFLTRQGRDDPAAEGILGMCLCLTQEFPAVHFKSVCLDGETDVEAALAHMFAPGPLHLIYREGVPYTLGAAARPLHLPDEPDPVLQPGAVVVISGGGRGITARMAEAFLPFRPVLILLGRTEYPGSLRPDTAEGLSKACAEIHQTLTRLREGGAEAEYRRCDVTDGQAVSGVLEGVARRYGRIDGVIHGAGILRDALLPFMGEEQFREVVEIKVLGAAHLLEAARPHGLRFAAALSSLGAAAGNPGQCNYAAANRALAACLESAAGAAGKIRTKTLFLPPVEGAGMADTAEIRAFLNARGLADAFAGIEEITAAFSSELLSAPPEPGRVLFTRRIPDDAPMPVEPPSARLSGVQCAGVQFEPRQVPLIDRVVHWNETSGRIVLERHIRPDHDLWLEDHRPFKSMPHPLVSGIMIVEAFLEAAWMLFPYLVPDRAEAVVFSDMIPCPLDGGCRMRIQGRVQRGAEPRGRFTLSAREGGDKAQGRWIQKSAGEIVLAAPGLRRPLDPLPVSGLQGSAAHGLSSREAQERYRMYTGLGGRYRVLHSIDAYAPESIRGRMHYPAEQDFAPWKSAGYRFSPYLLEGVAHLVGYHVRLCGRERAALPAGFRELRFSRRCAAGETVLVHAFRREKDDTGETWDAWATDAAAKPLLTVRGFRIQWWDVPGGP